MVQLMPIKSLHYDVNMKKTDASRGVPSTRVKTIKRIQKVQMSAEPVVAKERGQHGMPMLQSEFEVSVFLAVALR